MTSLLHRVWTTCGVTHVRSRIRLYAIQIPRVLRLNSSSTSSTPTRTTIEKVSATIPPKPKKVIHHQYTLAKKANFLQSSFLNTHGEAIFRLILVSQATFGTLTVFWWHMYYFEIQDTKNGIVPNFIMIWESHTPEKLIFFLNFRGNCDIKATIKRRDKATNF